MIAKWAEKDFGYALYASGEASNVPEGFITEHEWLVAYADASEAIPLSAWTHIALTNDGEHLCLYVDGVLVDEHASEKVKAGESPLRIGGLPGGPYSQFFDGKIDEVRIYDRALSQEEVEGTPRPRSAAPENRAKAANPAEKALKA